MATSRTLTGHGNKEKYVEMEYMELFREIRNPLIEIMMSQNLSSLSDSRHRDDCRGLPFLEFLIMLLS